MLGHGERKNSGGSQATKSQLPTFRTSETTPGETFVRVTAPGDSLVRSADGLTQDTFKICKEFLRPFKKCLRKLNLPKDFPEEKRLLSTRKNLIILGDHINMFLQHYCKTWELKLWKKMLWRFVSLFSALDEKQLCKLYRYSKTNQRAKFLKAYCHLESPDLVTLPDNSNLMKLRDTWGLRGGSKRQEKPSQIHSLLPGRGQPKKRLQKTSKKRRKTGGGLLLHGTPTLTRSKGAELSSVSQEALLKMDR